MSADDSKPPASGGPRRPEKTDGYSEAFQEGIAEAAFYVKQGLYDEAIAALEELQRTHGPDPRILGRLHVARTKQREATPAATQPEPTRDPLAQPKAAPRATQPKVAPRATRPKAAPRATQPKAAPPPTSGPPLPQVLPQASVIDTADPGPLHPIPDFEERTSNAITNPITIPLDLEGASAVEVEPAPFDEPAVLPKRKAASPPVPMTPVTPLGRRASIEVELEVEEDQEPPPLVKPVAAATPLVKPVAAATPSVKPVAAAMPSVKPVAAATPSVKPVAAAMPSVKPVAAATPPVKPKTADPPVPPAPAAASPLKPFERKRAVLEADPTTPARGRTRVVLLVGGAVLLVSVVVIVLVFVLRGRGAERPARSGDTRTVSSEDDSMGRPGPRRPPEPRRAGTPEPLRSMSAMAPVPGAGGDAPRRPAGGDVPSRPTGGDDPGSTMGGDDPGGTMGGDDPGSTMGGDDPGGTMGGDVGKPKVQLRLTIEPRRADAVVHFRGSKYITRRFVSKKVKPRSTEETITITARGYLKKELKVTLDQDLERTVKLKRRPRRMKLFDLRSKKK